MPSRSNWPGAAVAIGLSVFPIQVSRLAAAPTYNRDIRPILSDNCFACHGPDKHQRKKDLRLDVREVALEKGAFKPGDPDGSKMIRRLLSTDPDEMMPPPSTHKHLKPADIASLRQWIKEGAAYEPHWAYIPIKRPAVPEVTGLNPVDAFVRARLVQEKIEPSQPADPATLIRRLSLDLTGLPPTPAEADQYRESAIQDPKSAVDSAVARLLASPHFGERMAVPWLDLVRFADTVGYHGDQNQRIFPYRDYVIDAFNSNERFDQFTAEQLAGDLLYADQAAGSKDQRLLVASGFNRLNMMTREGGAQPGEYLAKYEADRVRTVSMVWLGATMGCCECHDHKFDPLKTKDFYSMEAFFADLREWGVYQDYGYTPNPDLRGWSNEHPFPPEIQIDSPALHERITKLRKKIMALTPGEKAEDWGPVEAVKTGDDWRAVVAGPRTVTTVRIEVPAGAAPGGFQLKLKVEPPGGPVVKPVVAPAAPAPKPTAARKPAKAAKPVDPSLAEAFADLQKPRYTNGFDALSVKENWVSDPAHVNETHTAVYHLKAPVDLGEGESLVLTATTKEPSDLKISVTPAGGLLPAEGAPVPIDPARYDEFLTLRQELAECRQGKAWTQITVAQQPRTMRVLARGNWMDESGEIVTANVPAVFQKSQSTGGSPPSARLTRLDLARWLCGPDNPLTARVVVNRLWAMFFGAGLAPKLDDLGAQGDWPAHSELLDWLAAEFRESGWDIKHMVTLMVTSLTYQQSSNVRPELADKDPGNRLLARQNPRRLEAEFVRDNALAISGLLCRDIGGPSAFPYQPAGYYENLNFPQRDYYPSPDERQYRRGVYMHWQRTFMHPMLANFDAPSREECRADRTVSNTPQQALTLLNDPTFVECARALAEKMLRALPDAGLPQRFDYLFQNALGRARTEDERHSLVAFIAEQTLTFSKDEAAARKVLKNGISPPPSDLPAGTLAAWTMVARVVLNLHETITRE